jgi:adenylate cyclase
VPERIVRVRIKGDKGFITIKGISNTSGLSRYEWEKEIPLPEARELLDLCEPGIVDKTRFLIKAGDWIIEVDEFHGDNLGLIMAEVELSTELDVFEKPDWLGEEVTGDKRYYNSCLSKNPFSRW